MNARERLAAIANWYSWQDEHLSSGLKSLEDAIKLYDYAQSAKRLPEMADEWGDKQLKKTIGYNPFTNGRDHCSNEDCPLR